MARGKKKEENLTLEEKLEQALAPEEEWPYEVPGNWCWTRLKWIAKWGSGGTPSRKNPEYYTGNIPWVKTGELNDGKIYFTEEYITEDALNNSSAKLYPVKTVIMAMYGATIGKTAILEINASTNQACACAVCLGAMNYKYLFYYLRLQTEYFVNKSKGGAQPNISQEIIKEHEIPLPPLEEQKRIIFYIENLFTKLDEAKEKVQYVLESSENRKAAILHTAFSGELTEQWRQEQGIRKEDWKEETIESICDGLKYGTSKKSENDGKVVVVRMGNLQDGEIVWDNLAYTNDIEDIKKYYLQTGDVLFNRTNSPDLVGKTAIYRGQYPAIYAGYLIKLNYKRNIVNGDYLNYYLNSLKAKEYCNMVKTDGVNQSNINSKKLGAFHILIPEINEQKEIVNLINKLFLKENYIIQVCKIVSESIDLLKKSILSRAFRGELGTNNPDEESAIELLKTIL